MTSDLRVFRDTYVDSVIQLAATRAMNEVNGVEWAAAAMATPANLRTLTQEGFSAENLGSANDLFLAVRGSDEEAVQAALSAGTDSMFATRESGDGTSPRHAHRTIGRAVRELPGINVAVVSVPGEYAALEAHQALTEGLHVLLFSDNVSVEEEVELKERANAARPAGHGPGRRHGGAGRHRSGLRQRLDACRRGRGSASWPPRARGRRRWALLDRWGVGDLGDRCRRARPHRDAVEGRMARPRCARCGPTPRPT